MKHWFQTWNAIALWWQQSKKTWNVYSYMMAIVPWRKLTWKRYTTTFMNEFYTLFSHFKIWNVIAIWWQQLLDKSTKKPIISRFMCCFIHFRYVSYSKYLIALWWPKDFFVKRGIPCASKAETAFHIFDFPLKETHFTKIRFDIIKIEFLYPI